MNNQFGNSSFEQSSPGGFGNTGYDSAICVAHLENIILVLFFFVVSLVLSFLKFSVRELRIVSHVG